MTDDQQKEPESRRSEVEWTFAFDQLEQFGENIAGWLTQLGIGADADLQQTNLTEPRGTAKRGRVRLDMTIGKAMLHALPAGSENLIEVDVVSVGAVEMSATTEGEAKSVRLRQKRSSHEDFFKPMKDAVDSVARIDQLQWDVRLSPDVPLSVQISAGLTIDEFDFTGLQLSKLKMDGGTGRTVVTLPAGVSNAEIEGGVGILDLHIPDDAKSTLEMDLSAGATNVYIGKADVKAEIEGGVGNCTVIVPADAAVRLRADSGLGNIVVPETLKPVEFESEFISESGIWETAGYVFAVNKIDLRYEGGVGSLIIQFADDGTPTAE